MLETQGKRVYAAVLLVAGCSRQQQGPERLPTVPVRGVVTVDDIPAADLSVKLHSVAVPEGEAAIYAAKPTALTEGDGTFSVSTYENGDGVAAGEYVVTFEWLKFDRIANSYGGPDRLGNRYSDPAKSPFKIKVKGDEKNGLDVGKFNLYR